jgi:hypothetical protein
VRPWRPLRLTVGVPLDHRVERACSPFVICLDGDGRQRIVQLPAREASLSIGRGHGSDIPLPWDRGLARSADAAAPELSTAQRRVLQALCDSGRDGPYAGPPSNRELFDVGDLPQNRKRAELVRRAFERGLVR